ncbi:MAG: leader peptidase (prepilin peptidase)/N-methyltransferase [Candidatus Aldehydirespiratoraceae bacterium]
MGSQTDEQAQQLAKNAPLSPRQTWTFWSAIRASTIPTLAVAGIGCLVAAASSLTNDVPIAAAIAPVALIPAALVDVLDRRLPNRIVVGALALTTAAFAVTLIFGGDLRLGDGLIGASLMASPLLVIHVISPRSMGVGDVKAAVVLGIGLGLIAPELTLVALVVGSAGTATIGLLRRQRDTAFGPGLVAGTIATIALVALQANLVNTFEQATSNPPPLAVAAEQGAPQ